MTLTALNAIVFLFLTLSYFSTFNCSNSTEESGYTCFLNDDCRDIINSTISHHGNDTFCCNKGDVLQISITGPNFEFLSNSYINYRIQKREEDDVTDVKPPANGTQFKCTCKVITEDYLNEILEKNEKILQENQKIFDRISNFWKDAWDWEPFEDWFR